MPALAEMVRVLVPGGRLCVNLANVVRSNVQKDRATSSGNGPGRCAAANGKPWGEMVAPHFWRAMADLEMLPREQIVWVKGSAEEDVTTNSTAWGSWLSAQNPVLRAVSEPIFVASKGSYAREPGISDLTRDEYMAWTRNVWFVPCNKLANGAHPAQFPPELVRRLVKLYSYRGDTVLDLFAGSGTTPMVADREGRRGIGVDISKKYTRLARGRCSQRHWFDLIAAASAEEAAG